MTTPMPGPKTITPGQRFEAIGLLTLGWSLNSQLSSVERLLVELTGDGDCGLTSDLLYSTIRDDATRAVDDLLQSLKVTVEPDRPTEEVVRLRRALGAYRSAVRSGEPETGDLRVLYDEAVS